MRRSLRVFFDSLSWKLENSYRSPIYGSVEDIKENVLPTYEEGMKLLKINAA